MPLCRAGLHETPLTAGYCSECAICQYCHKQLTVTEYNWCYAIAAKHEVPVSFQHPGCFSELERLTVNSESITIPRILFEKLNAARLLLEPIPELSHKTNEFDSEIKTRQFIHEMKLEDQFLVLKRLESAASTVSMLLSKHRREIEQTLSERDKAKYEKARQGNREKTKEEKAAEKAEKERLAHANRAPGTTGRVEAKKLTKEEKAIAALISIGLSESEAKESIKRKIQ